MAGRIIAIKGLGGFQLACRADDDSTVRLLRRRKRRRGKPFAVMVRDLETARRVVLLSPEDEDLLSSSRAPVILAPRVAGSVVSDEIAPGLDDIGVMLPTTPLHVELFRDERIPALVMTSANLSEEPICRGNREAVDRLENIADGFLLHDRDVIRRVDDSVVRTTADGPILVRRARGWVPDPISLPVHAPEPLLAVGGHLLVTSCIAVKGQAFMTQHVGDLDSVAARAFHREVIDGLEDFLEVRPARMIADAHPDYPSSWLAAELAEQRGGSLLEVQHHLAHGAAVLGEHGRFPEAERQGVRHHPRRHRVGARRHRLGRRVAQRQRDARVATARPPRTARAHRRRKRGSGTVAGRRGGPDRRRRGRGDSRTPVRRAWWIRSSSLRSSTSRPHLTGLGPPGRGDSSRPRGRSSVSSSATTGRVRPQRAWRLWRRRHESRGPTVAGGRDRSRLRVSRPAILHAARGRREQAHRRRGTGAGGGGFPLHFRQPGCRGHPSGRRSRWRAGGTGRRLHGQSPPPHGSHRGSCATMDSTSSCRESCLPVTAASPTARPCSGRSPTQGTSRRRC